MCISSDTLQVGERLKLYKEEKMPSKAMGTWTDVPGYFCEKESYRSGLTFIKVAFPYMQQTYFYLIKSLLIKAFPKHSQNLYEVLVLLKC